MILENKTTKILHFNHPRKLHPSKICTYMVIYVTWSAKIGVQKLFHFCVAIT